jgi:hypothetical protein
MKISQWVGYYLRPKRHVIQFSPVRTGSTVIYNLLRECLPGKTVTKTHTYSPHFSHLPVVATTRHPFDCISSMLQVRSEEPNEKNIRSTVARFNANGGHDLIRIKNKKPILLLKYEDFVHNYESVFTSFEKFFAITISAQQRAELTHKYSLEKAREIAAAQKQWGKWDPVTKIHGNHISKFGGQPSYYKEYFTAHQIDLLKHLFTDYLREFNYA